MATYMEHDQRQADVNRLGNLDLDIDDAEKRLQDADDNGHHQELTIMRFRHVGLIQRRAALLDALRGGK